MPIAREVRSAGGFVAIEWPHSCDYWSEPSVVSFVQELQLGGVVVHGCMVGLRARSGPNLGKPIKKPWRICSNLPELRSHLGVVCDKSHVHTKCQGADTRISEGYTREFAARVHNAFASNPEVLQSRRSL